MSFKELLKRIETSPEFKNFKKKYPNAKLYSAFFTLRKAFGTIVEDSQQLDYLLGENKIVTFFLQDEEVKLKQDELEKKVQNFKGLNKKISIDIEELKEIIEKEINKQKIKSDIQEIVAILQMENKIQIWNVIVLLSSFEMLRLHIDMQGKIFFNTKESFMDFIKIKKQEN
ncbi:MAG: hypothetical protein QXL88_02350 [Candidatus Pacearchaeota archaeon]